jgi:hypothetical protein
MAFKPGESGNPAGSAKIKRFYAALDRAIVQEDGKRLREAAEKLLDEAAKGESWAMQMLADRLDGKAAQSVTIAGDADNPIVVQEIARTIIE